MNFEKRTSTHSEAEQKDLSIFEIGKPVYQWPEKHDLVVRMSRY